MAGKDQHYDPRFLLKGFRSKGEGKKVFVWHFTKSSSPREVSTRDIGHANLFYGMPGEGSLDDRITTKETTEYAVVVERIRKNLRIQSSDRTALAEFVYFQGARTRAARELYHEVLVSSLKDAHQEFSKPDTIKEMMSEVARPDNKDLRERFRRKLKEMGMKLSYKKEMLLFHKTLREQREAVIEKEAPKQALIADVTFSAALKNSDKLIEQAHNQALDAWIKTQSKNPGSGLKRYFEMNWDVQSLPENSLIFGDAAVLYREKDALQLSAGTGPASLVLLPLSHNLLLVGSADADAQRPPVEDINRASAELSLYFFVSRSYSEREEEYRNLIGKRAPSVEKE